METFVLYNLKVAACLAVFYLFYKLLLSRETFHRLNRVLLLSAVVLSFALPFCVVTVEREIPAAPKVEMQTVNMPREAESAANEVVGAEASNPVPVTVEPASEPFPWARVGIGIFIAGVVLSLAGTLFSLFCTLRIIRRGRHEILDDGLILSRHDGAVTPFSWGRWIVISETDYAESGAEILAHERAHIRCRHSWDLLLTDVMSCLQWFNPAMWLLRTELRALHEFEADAAVLAAGADAKQYQLLLIKKAVGGRWYSVANSLNHSNLKNRITMMLRKRSSRWARAKSLVVLPLLCIALGAFARTSYVVPDGEGTEIPETEQGFTGNMTLRLETEGRLKAAFDGKGDAMAGTAGLICFSLSDFEGPRRLPKGVDSSKMREFVRIVVALSPAAAAQAQGYPRPLMVVDGKKRSDTAPEAGLITSLYVLDRQQGAAAYGAEGADGVVEITSKRADEPSAAFAEEGKREDLMFCVCNAVDLYGGYHDPSDPTCDFSFHGGLFSWNKLYTQEMYKESERKAQEQLDKTPLERFFVGTVAAKLTKDGAVEFTVYGVGDAMMAASSVFSQPRIPTGENGYLEITSILYRLSRNAQDSPGYMADPMPLCLVDGRPVTSYRDVPQADRITTMVVYDKKQGAGKFGPQGANGVVDVVSTEKMPASLALIDVVKQGACLSWMSAMNETEMDGEKLTLSRGFISQRSGEVGGFSRKNRQEALQEYGLDILYVVDGAPVPIERVELIRPSQIENIDYAYEQEASTAYGVDPEKYACVVDITTKYGIDEATKGVGPSVVDK